jgi:hypothetical protein
MKQLFVALLVIGSLTQLVWAEEKPDLESAQILAYTTCPEESAKTCYLLRVGGDTYYLVQGQGYSKEEYIWLIDSDAAVRDYLASHGRVNPRKYLTLVWTSHST